MKRNGRVRGVQDSRGQGNDIVRNLSGICLFLCFLILPLTTHAETIGPLQEILSVTVKDLSPGLHCFRISAIDRAGNESEKSPEACVQLDAPTTIFFSPKTFGDTLTIRQRYKTFSVYNTGAVDLTCKKPQIGGPNAADFSTDFLSDVRTVPPGKTIAFKVFFKPAQIGNRIASLIMQCNIDGAPLAIVLTGRGI